MKAVKVEVAEKKAVAYLRTATELQGSNHSFKAQQSKIKSYAEAMNIEIVGEFSDEGKSGNTLDNRLGFISMLEAIETGKIKVDCVIVEGISRIGRSTHAVRTALDRMEKCGVSVICLAQGIDSSTSSGKLLLKILESVHDLEAVSYGK